MAGAGSRPAASTETIRQRMIAQRRRDTAPELVYRRALFSLGLRFRVDYQIPPLRRRADIVFTRWRLVVFIDGCFWHSCPLHATVPKRHRDWWLTKLQANIARDRDTDSALQAAGWLVVRIWEHEPPEKGVPRVLDALSEAGRS
jgi:DNA mismatch endonuclease (patch repair protein)